MGDELNLLHSARWSNSSGAGGAEGACSTTPPPKGGVGVGRALALPNKGGAKTGQLLAVDIGRTGGLALLDGAGKLLAVEDMPVLGDGPASRPTVNGPLLALIVKRWQPAQAVIEFVASRPGEAPTGAFAFGHSRGVVEGVLACQAVPVRLVTPAWWKRRVGIPAGRDMKDMARSVAIARWPDRAEWFARVKDHDRAEAALIGLAFIAEQAGRSAA